MSLLFSWRFWNALQQWTVALVAVSSLSASRSRTTWCLPPWPDTALAHCWAWMFFTFQHSKSSLCLVDRNTTRLLQTPKNLVSCLRGLQGMPIQRPTLGFQKHSKTHSFCGQNRSAIVLVFEWSWRSSITPAIPKMPGNRSLLGLKVGRQRERGASKGDEEPCCAKGEVISDEAGSKVTTSTKPTNPGKLETWLLCRVRI